MGMRDYLSRRGLKLLQDRRLARVFQDERVVRAMMRALELRGRIQERLDERIEGVARSLNLATKRELRELKRTLRRVEQDLERERRRRFEAAPGAPSRS